MKRLEDYAEEQGAGIVFKQETQHPHSGEEGDTEKLDWEGNKVGGKYKWYFSSGIDPKVVEAWGK